MAKRYAEIGFCGILFAFWFQLLADFIAAVYAFGLLGTSIPPELASVVLLFTPVVLLLLPRGLRGWPLAALGVGAFLCRAVEPALATRWRMLVSGVGVGCCALFFPAWLYAQARKKQLRLAAAVGGGMTLALALSILFRALGSGLDPSTEGATQAIGWPLAAVGIILLLTTLRSTWARGDEPAREERGHGKAWRAIGLAVGWSSAFALLYLSFTAPNVIARWTGASYLVILAAVAIVLSAWAWLTATARFPVRSLSPAAVTIWNVVFVLALVLTIGGHQVRFPPDPAAYPLAEPVVQSWQYVPLALMLLSFPVLLLDVQLFTAQLIEERPTARAMGAGYALAALFLLVLVLGQVFTTVYDYIPVIGPFFRDRFWLIYAAAGIGLTLPTLLVREDATQAGPAGRSAWVLPALVTLAGLVAYGGATLAAPRPTAGPAPGETLRVCTYNIQQGYDAHGLKNVDGQLALLRRIDADVIGLQESDTNRAAGGNGDAVRYLADRLEMYSYYGPKTVPGTFGVALLSRYPIEQARTFYMYSAGEQTATIAARVRVGEESYNVYVTHLGNEGPIVQQEAVLEEIASGNVILVGDFNFRPDTPQYRLTTDVLDDAWALKWPQGVDDEGRQFPQRIDHVFVSPGTNVIAARYYTEPESDHPALAVEIER
ncbi:MAG TPA: endonuclease/exonuclease/phosphatase family protein [Anaerolineae bacterium]|nr:endonuclease/exonuclease/phosphatase family protein [Anaerolineae bacterium]